MSNGRFIVNNDTGVVLPWTPAFAAYKDLNWDFCDGPVAPEVPALAESDQAPGVPVQEVNTTPETPAAESTPEARAAAIKYAVAKVDVANYGQAGFGFPAMPKLDDIRALTGFADVTREEIAAAMVV